MAKTYKDIFSILGQKPQTGDRIESGKSSYQLVEGVRTTPEGFKVVTLSPSIIVSTGERQGRSNELILDPSGTKFLGAGGTLNTNNPVDFSSSRIGTQGAIKEYMQQFKVFGSTDRAGKQVYTVHATAENFATQAEANARAQQLQQQAFGGAKIDASSADMSRVDQAPNITGPRPVATQPSKQTLGTAGAGQTVQEKILAGIEQAKLLKEKLVILETAARAGLRIDPGTTVEDAERFLATGSVEAPPPAPQPEPTPPAPGNLTKDNITDVPTDVEFRNTDAYKNLTQDEKDFIDMGFQLITLGGEQDARVFANAISEAKKIADPYFKAQISLTQAEIVGKISELNLDYDTKKEIIERTQKELSEDVASQKEFLTLEQQADIAKATKTLDQDLLNLRDQAASKGLTFSTLSESAQSRTTGNTQNVIESTQRQNNFKIKALETQAARGNTSAQAQLAAMQKQKTLGFQTLGRSAESTLGSAGISSALTGGGYAPVGGVGGTIEEEKRKAIIGDTSAFVSLSKGFL